MKLNILLASSQVRGIDGTGGLGDVATGLAKELKTRQDVEIRLAIPGFEEITNLTLRNRFDASRCVLRDLAIPFGDRMQTVDVFESTVPGTDLLCYLIRCPEVFDRPDPATGKVNKNTPDKAILFCRAVVEALMRFEKYRVDLVHCNDWHTGLIPVYLNAIYGEDPYLGRIATLFTTHNAGGDAYQGAFPQNEDLLNLAGLTRAGVFGGGEPKSLCHYNKFNFSKGAIGFADVVNTVSKKYREELMTSAFAGGLEGLFDYRRSAFTGVVNGIDTEEWDPASDNYLGGVTFDAAMPVRVVLERKQSVRALLRGWTVPQSSRSKAFKAGDAPFAGLSQDSVLIGLVSRVDYQKMPIVLAALDRLMGIPDVSVVVLGNADANDPLGTEYERELRARAGRLFFYDGFDIGLSHLIYAASELFVTAPVFEPCGLTQLVAMRYGSVPVVRSVGGQVDTVIDEADPNRMVAANGFCFKESVPASAMVDEKLAADQLFASVQRAVGIRNSPRWEALVLNGMSRDSSWRVPASQYVKLYAEAVRRHVNVSFFAA